MMRLVKTKLFRLVLLVLVMSLFLSAFGKKEIKVIGDEEEQKLEREIELVFFTNKKGCNSCNDIEKLVSRIVSYNSFISVTTVNVSENKAKSLIYNVDKAPQIVIKQKNKHFGIKYKGMPSGHLIDNFVEAIRLVYYEQSGLSEEIKKELAGLEKEVHIEVIATPSCPKCPAMVSLAQRFAIESKYISVDIINAYDHRHIAQKYNVVGVPTTAINGKIVFPGAVGQKNLMQYIKQATKD